MREIKLIIIHCSATTSSMNWGAAEIKDVHVRQNGWADIGYHHIIRRDGTVEPGRKEATAGAHAKGYNAKSIGVCMIGGCEKYTSGKRKGQLYAANNFTAEQWSALAALVKSLLKKYPNAAVIGHRDVEPNKECPSFSVKDWLQAVQITPKRPWT